MKLPDILQYSKSLKVKLSGLFDRDRAKMELTSYRDWMILLAAFLVFIFTLVLAGVAFYLFINIDSGEIFTIGQEEDATFQLLDINELNQITGFFKGKEKELEELLLRRPSIIDPSR